MSNLKKFFGTDKKVEQEGVVHDYGDFTITIARAGGSNKAFGKLFESLSKPHRRAIQTETISEDVMLDILYEVYAKTIVKDWSGVTDDNGVEIPYSADACIKMFKEFPDFYQTVSDDANKINLFRLEEDAADEKN